MKEPETELVRLSCRAMNTTFEMALWGRPEEYLRGAGEAAFEEIHRLEQQLSFFRSDSEIHALNTYAALEAVPVDPRLFRLLERARRLSEESEGAFDITIAPLLKAWGFSGGSGRMPGEEELAAARAVTGMNLVELNEADFTVRFTRPGVMLDLGAIGKGYAIEEAAELLREAEIGGGLIHGGTSTVQAVGSQPDGAPWSIAIQSPIDPAAHLALVPLQDCGLSVSGAHGKFFTEGDTRYGHVLDPRIGRPAQRALLAVVAAPSATDTDALSTALLTLGEPFLEGLTARESTRGLLALPHNGGIRLLGAI